MLTNEEIQKIISMSELERQTYLSTGMTFVQLEEAGIDPASLANPILEQRYQQALLKSNEKLESGGYGTPTAISQPVDDDTTSDQTNSGIPPGWKFDERSGQIVPIVLGGESGGLGRSSGGGSSSTKVTPPTVDLGMENMPRIITNPNVENQPVDRTFFNLMSTYASEIRKDSLSGGNITDIYKAYLGGK